MSNAWEQFHLSPEDTAMQMLVYSETLGKFREVKGRVIFTLFRPQQSLERRLTGGTCFNSHGKSRFTVVMSCEKATWTDKEKVPSQ